MISFTKTVPLYYAAHERQKWKEMNSFLTYLTSSGLFPFKFESTEEVLSNLQIIWQELVTSDCKFMKVESQFYIYNLYTSKCSGKSLLNCTNLGLRGFSSEKLMILRYTGCEISNTLVTLNSVSLSRSPSISWKCVMKLTATGRYS